MIGFGSLRMQCCTGQEIEVVQDEFILHGAGVTGLEYPSTIFDRDLHELVEFLLRIVASFARSCRKLVHEACPTILGTYTT